MMLSLADIQPDEHLPTRHVPTPFATSGRHGVGARRPGAAKKVMGVDDALHDTGDVCALVDRGGRGPLAGVYLVTRGLAEEEAVPLVGAGLQAPGLDHEILAGQPVKGAEVIVADRQQRQAHQDSGLIPLAAQNVPANAGVAVYVHWKNVPHSGEELVGWWHHLDQVAAFERDTETSCTAAWLRDIDWGVAARPDARVHGTVVRCWVSGGLEGGANTVVMYGMTPVQQWRDFRDGVRWRRNRQDVTIGDQPYLDGRGLAHFQAALAESRVYLEYGAGGSTMQASRIADVVVCAETDADYLAAVRQAVGESRAKMSFCHADIGTTVEWGIPLIKIGTAKQRVLWTRYPWVPWDVLGEQVPDLVMIDGRFRVASAAASMMRAPGARVLFDDYLDRPFYWAIDAVADRVAEAGRLVEFRRRASISDEQLMQVVNAYVGDWR